MAQEAQLLDYAERLARHREGRIALHVHLSRLQQHNRRDHHLRVARGTFEDLVKNFEGAVFTLMNQDMVFICKGAKVEDIDQVVLKLRYLFSEDPLTRFSEEGSGESGFVTWYQMENDFERFVSMAKRFNEISEAHKNETARVRRQAQPQRKQKAPMSSSQLASLEKSLSQADLSSLVRNQPICAIITNQPPQPIFYEMFVSISDLEDLLIPGVSMTAEPWLFQQLTQTLDKRLLNQVLRDNASSERAFSLNLNVQTLLSDEFQRFDQGIGFGVRGRLVIEIQKIDIFHDMGAYIFARDYLHERGYKVCLDGLTPMTFSFIDRSKLGLDLLKLMWTDELMSSSESSAQDLKQAIKQAGQARVILTRCDNETAVKTGQSMGISLFQGRYIDAILAQRRPDARLSALTRG